MKELFFDIITTVVMFILGIIFFLILGFLIFCLLGVQIQKRDLENNTIENIVEFRSNIGVINYV